MASLNRPGGNATGVNFFTVELVAKRMQLLLELVPAAKRVGFLAIRTEPEGSGTLHDVEAAAEGRQILVREVASGRDIDAAFADMTRDKVDIVFVAPGSFFNSRRVQLAILAARHALPAIYPVRAYPEVGGLVSYGTDVLDAFRHVGLYTARVLKGAKPADLPVLQSTKFELVINLNTARALGLDVSPSCSPVPTRSSNRLSQCASLAALHAASGMRPFGAAQHGRPVASGGVAVALGAASVARGGQPPYSRKFIA